MRLLFRRFTAWGCLACAGLIGGWPARGQSGAPPASAPTTDSELSAKIEALSESLEQTRTELAQSRQEIKQLRSMLEQIMENGGTRNGALTSAGPAGTAVPPGQSPAEQSGNELRNAQITPDDWQIANARIEELAQDKVESDLKHRVKLSGIVLLNAFSQSGQVDNLDAPTIALPYNPAASSGSVGASLRQSIIGLTGIGPTLFGAETVADVQFDFFGGLPAGYAANTSGTVRLRVARLRMNWEHTSLFGGVDVPFFAPNLPTSYMSLAVPEFASAGNLWTWVPTVGVEQRIDAGPTQLKVQAGVMDPPTYALAAAGVRGPSAAESSRQPTYAVRLSVNGNDERTPLSFGISGIYSPQRYADDTNVGGWGSVADWRFPLFPHAELSGEMFVGKGMDAFGGVPAPVPAGGDYNYYVFAAPALARITMAGGWAQLKMRLDARNEFNFGAGSGGRDSAELRRIQPLDAALAILSPRNDMLFVNYVFRARSDLVFSPEFRRIRTYPASGPASIASQVGVAAGFLF